MMHLGRLSYLKVLSVQQQLVLKYKQYKDMNTLGEVICTIVWSALMYIPYFDVNHADMLYIIVSIR